MKTRFTIGQRALWPAMLLALAGLWAFAKLNPAAVSQEEKPASESTPAAVAPAASDASVDVAQATTTAWPVFRGNANGNGVAPGSLPADLEPVWEHKFPDSSIESTAAIADGAIYVGTLESQNGNLVALNLSDGSERWRFPGELGFSAPAAVHRGKVYIGDFDGTFHCVDAANGQEVWKTPTDQQVNAGANFYGDKVLFGSQDGSLFCAHALTGEVAWKYEINNMIQCSPTIVGTRVFLAGCDGILHVIDVETGAAIDKLDLQDATFNTPAAEGDFVYFAGIQKGGMFYAIDWKKPAIDWTYQNARRGEVRSSAAVAKGLAMFGGRNKIMHGIDAATGAEKWTFAARGAIETSPVVVGSTVYFGSHDGRMYGLDLQTGAKVWEYECGGRILASPAVAAGRLVVGNNAGTLFCFGAK